jgi:NAD(P)H-hydrate epimerase
MTGAACLSGISALRAGAGLVTIVTPKVSADIYRNYCPSLIVETFMDISDFSSHCADIRRNVVLVGPGAGLKNSAGLKGVIASSVASDKICVFDADALTLLSEEQDFLRSKLHQKCILTPHEGEFKKLFPDLGGNKVQRASAASALTNSIVVLKGAETIIAAPDGRIEILTNGSPWLATAGSGDVLAGIIAGLCASREEEVFEAVCAAVWMHGRASQIAGPGMISADLPDCVPQVWKELTL